MSFRVCSTNLHKVSMSSKTNQPNPYMLQRIKQKIDLKIV
jgi:hypothetical protein